MRNGNVLNFPISSESRERSRNHYTLPELQLELFTCNSSNIPAISFVQIEYFNQHTFLSFIIRNSIKNIVDLRGRPIFPKPNFDHKYVLNYLFNESINYIEYAMSKSMSCEQRLVKECDRFKSENYQANYGLSSGITICLVDTATIDNGTVSFFRNQIAHHIKNLVEIHPRSLIQAQISKEI